MIDKSKYWATQDGKIISASYGEIGKQIGNHGYKNAYVRENGKRVNYLAHRFIWEYFYGPIPKDRQINHKNGNKLDNSLSNLELVTPIENIQHAIHLGLSNVTGEANARSKLTEKDVRQIRKAYKFREGKKLAKKFGVTHSLINCIILRKIWKHVG